MHKMKYIEGNMYSDIMCDFKIKTTQNMHWMKCIKLYVLNEMQNIKHIPIKMRWFLQNQYNKMHIL